MLPAIAAALIGAGVSGVGMALKNTQRKQNQQDQKDLMNLQQQNQMGLNRQMQQIEMENWENTNYDAQKKQMEKAGLNPGLMYGGSGGGSMIMDSGSGGSAAGGQAQRQDIDTSGLGMQIQQMALLKAQKDNIEADTNKKNVEANKLQGVDTGNVQAETNVKNLQAKNLELENKLRSDGLDSALYQLKANADKAQSEARSALIKANVDENTKNSQIKKINSEAANEAFKLTLMEADKNLTNEKARAITQELAQEWERLSIELDKVGIGKMDNAIKEFTAKMNARLGTQNLEMRRIEAGLNAAGSILKKGTNVDASGTRSTTINNY